MRRSIRRIWKADTFTQPILGLYADRSRLGDREYMKAHFPNLEYVENEGTGHFLMLEKAGGVQPAAAWISGQTDVLICWPPGKKRADAETFPGRRDCSAGARNNSGRAQNAAPGMPRMKDGKPNLTGLWQSSARLTGISRTTGRKRDRSINLARSVRFLPGRASSKG